MAWNDKVGFVGNKRFINNVILTLNKRYEDVKMYVPKGKRKFFITVREVRADNVLGDSESFSVYDSEVRMTRRELVDFLTQKINETDKDV